jgi:hypothetical protein
MLTSKNSFTHYSKARGKSNKKLQKRLLKGCRKRTETAKTSSTGPAEAATRRRCLDDRHLFQVNTQAPTHRAREACAGKACPSHYDDIQFKEQGVDR